MKKLYPLLAFIFVYTIGQAQSIPNPGFETWSNPNGYNVPQGWGTLNDATSEVDIFTCAQGAPGNPGDYYIKLTSRNISGFGVIPGIAVSGIVDVTTFQPVSGFAYTQRPLALTGAWQYMGMSANDIGYVSISLTKWDDVNSVSIPIGTGYANLTGMEMSWVNFSIPIDYTSDLFPDSCMIVMSASGTTPANNSFLYVDNLAFQLPAEVDENQTEVSFHAYPNPFNDQITIDLPQEQWIDQLTISNQAGEIVYQTGQTRKIRYDLAGLASGIYFVQIVSDGVVSRQKLLKQ